MAILMGRSDTLAAAFLVSQVWFASSTWAQAKPYPIQPIADPISISLVTGSKSVCNSNETFLLANQSNATTNSVTFTVESDPKLQKKYFTVTHGSGNAEVKVSFESQPDGKRLLDGIPKLSTTVNLPVAEQQQIMQGNRELMDVVRTWTNSIISGSISQGQSIDMPKIDLCQVAVGMPGKVTRSGFNAIGLASVNDRPSLVVAFETVVQCQVRDAKIDFLMNGWATFDVKSGLPSNKFESGSAFIPGLGKMEMTNVQQCTVSSP